MFSEAVGERRAALRGDRSKEERITSGGSAHTKRGHGHTHTCLGGVETGALPPSLLFTPQPSAHLVPLTAARAAPHPLTPHPSPLTHRLTWSPGSSAGSSSPPHPSPLAAHLPPWQ